MFSTIGDLIKPIKPVVDLLTTPIDLGITSFRLLDLAKLKLSATQFAKVERAIAAIKSTLDFIELVNSFGGESLLINFGTFTLGGAQLAGSSQAPLPVSTAPPPDLDAVRRRRRPPRSPGNSAPPTARSASRSCRTRRASSGC